MRLSVEDGSCLIPWMHCLQQFGESFQIVCDCREANGFDKVWQSTASVVLGSNLGELESWRVGALREHTAVVIRVSTGNKVGRRKDGATREIAILTFLVGRRGKLVLARFLMGNWIGSSAGPADSWILASSLTLPKVEQHFSALASVNDVRAPSVAWRPLSMMSSP